MEVDVGVLVWVFEGVTVGSDGDLRTAEVGASVRSGADWTQPAMSRQTASRQKPTLSVLPVGAGPRSR